ncbi:MAG: glycosyltransferase [Patescibacteria group bacterium]|nr:glycosyltransferase [Patescibacteria group bacterium]
MNVLMITGDRSFKAGHPRYELQRAAVEELVVVCWPHDSLLKILKIARAGRFDVVTAQDPFFRGHLAHHLVQFFGGRLNIQVHTDLSAQSLWRRLFARINLGFAHSVRAVSPKIKSQVEAMGITAPIVVLPVYIDIEAVHAAPKADKKPFAHFSKLILWAGRLEGEKNPEEAIRLMPAVLRAFPEAGLLIAGQGSRMQLLQDLAREQGLWSHVAFLGHRSDIASLYKIADVMVVTSWYEGYGAAMVEALAAGCPVVAPDVGVAREAGATVVEHRPQLAPALVDALRAGAKGKLLLHLPSAKEWAAAWVQTL